jgi:hypothetical protein
MGGTDPNASGKWSVAPHVLRLGGKSRGSLRVETAAGILGEWTWNDADPMTCGELAAKELTLPTGTPADRLRAWLVLRAEGGRIALDRTSLHRLGR